MIDLTDDLTALVTRATEALARGEVVKIGSVTVDGDKTYVRAMDAGRIPFSIWSRSTTPDADRRVLAEAIFAAERVTP